MLLLVRGSAAEEAALRLDIVAAKSWHIDRTAGTEVGKKTVAKSHTTQDMLRRIVVTRRVKGLVAKDNDSGSGWC